MEERTYRFDELDQTDEVVREMQALRDQVLANFRQIEEVNRKIDLSQPKPVDKKNKHNRGFVMKKTLLGICGLSFIVALIFTVGASAYTRSDINYDIVSNPETLTQLLQDVIGTSSTWTFTPRAVPTTGIAEGMVYYNDVANALYVSTDGATFTALAASSAVSLDQAYDVGAAITVDGDAVTLTVGASDNNSALTLTHNETSNNNDAMTITVAGTGDAIQITPGATTGGAINWIAKASGTTSGLIMDAATNNWAGADNVGLVHISSDSALTHNGAALLFIGNSTGQPKDGAEGYLARFVDSGTARTTAHAVEIETTNTTPALMLNNQLTITGTDSTGTLMAITASDTTGNSDTITIAHSGTGAALQITSSEADTQLVELISAASQTTWLQLIDGATGNWIGANDIGMLTLKGDTAGAHAGASLLNIQNSAQPITAAEGFLARFVSTGTARTNAYAVEIEVPATQPALAANGIVAISGQDAAGGAILQVAGIGATGNADAMTISNTGTGDCLQISPGSAGGGGLNMVAVASGTASLVTLDGSTNNWDGADNIGMLTINADDPYIHTGASAIVVNDSSTPIASAEGFLARFVHSGTARTNASAVEIEVPATQPALAINGITAISGQDNPGASLVQITGIDTTGNTDTVTITHSGSGDALQISPAETDSRAMSVTALAASTVSNVIIDAATNNWSGADNVGLLHINSDAALAHAGASLLQVAHATGQPVASAEGFLARFISTGTARTDGYAVEIEVPATQPALGINGITAITGQDAAGAALFQLSNTGTTGDADAMTIASNGAGDGLQITAGDADSVALNLVAAASQTTSLAKFDGATGSWLGANNVGMLHLTNDGALAHVNSSLLYIANSGVPQDDSRGSSLRIVDTGNAAAGTAGYAVYVSATDATVEAMYVDDGDVLVDEVIYANKGMQNAVGETLTANSDSGAASTIDEGVSIANVTAVTAGVNDWIVLPASTIGRQVTVFCNAGSAFEIRTPAASNDTINNVDSDGTQEFAAVDGSVYVFTCHTATGWIGIGYTNLGAHAAAVTPD